jgi:glyoxylase-like metal-dependent hydrolase (beta-lactamase superfamily II)
MENQSVPRRVTRFETSAGAQIFLIPVQVFSMLWGNVYLVLVNDEYGGDPYRVLIDTGSGYGDSNQHLETGLQSISDQLGKPLGWADLTHILITHGHIDHCGGLSYVIDRSSAQVGVHELDLSNLTNYEERLALVTRRLNTFLIEAGLSADQYLGLFNLYKATKNLYRSLEVDFTYEAIGMRLGPFEILHVPGHCAGQVVIRLHDVLFSGDHILEQTSPHQSPEGLTLSTGLGHYFRSLRDLSAWADGIRLTLGGHENPILDLPGRIAEIQHLHAERLQLVLELLEEPHTIHEVSRVLFGEVHGYNVLLALEEAGAHVEYLAQRGQLGIDNLPEYESSDLPLPIRYRRLPCRVD